MLLPCPDSAARVKRSASAPAAGIPSGYDLAMSLSASSLAPCTRADSTSCSLVAPKTTSRGSMPFPLVLDIFSPFSSTISAVRYTQRNGTLFMKCSPAMIMRATQKKRMSNPVTSTLVG